MTNSPDKQNSDYQRRVRFQDQPSDQHLAIPVGMGAIGTSLIRIIKTEENVRIEPWPIPVKGFAIFFYSLLVTVAVTVWLCGLIDKIGIVALIFAALFFVPVMVAIFVWVNSSMGTLPYLVLDRIEKTIELPRLQMKFPCEQVIRLVAVDRFLANGDRLWQVSLLIRQDDDWIYAHAFNQAGNDSSFLQSSFCEQVANSLGIELKSLRFSRKESKFLAPSVPGDSDQPLA